MLTVNFDDDHGLGVVPSEGLDVVTQASHLQTYTHAMTDSLSFRRG